MSVDPVERHLFFEGLFLKYGFDFRDYAEASLNRRLEHLLHKFKKDSVLDLLQFCLASNQSFREVLPGLTINTSEFFRDPLFYKALRLSVFPVMETYPSITIWIAGCSTGEEVLSLCISLEEHDLLRRTHIYATDINPLAIGKAKQGIYESTVISQFNINYAASGGLESPSHYYSTGYGLVQFDKRLLDRVTFLDHNLATDDVFIEANLIICRNVLIYFNSSLQDRVISLFARSLGYRGVLGIGPKESIKFLKANRYFDKLLPDQNIFAQKVRAV